MCLYPKKAQEKFRLTPTVTTKTFMNTSFLISNTASRKNNHTYVGLQVFIFNLNSTIEISIFFLLASKSSMYTEMNFVCFISIRNLAAFIYLFLIMSCRHDLPCLFRHRSIEQRTLGMVCSHNP